MAGNQLITQEPISGVRAVSLSTSGNIQIAMASVPSRLPAVGVVFDSFDSGTVATFYDLGGIFQFNSGLADYSGYLGQQVYVGRSGQIVTSSGSWNSGGFVSGDSLQSIGVIVNSGAINLASFAPTTSGGFLGSGVVGPNQLASGIITSGFWLGSGSVYGQAAGGIFIIASGSISKNDIGSGAITSGQIASGQVGDTAISSGAVTSGRIGTTGTPDGTKFLRDDFSWATAGGGLSSGNVGSGFLASGSVQGFFGATRDIASGTVGVFDFGSGAVVAGTVGSGAIQSGNIASGQVGQKHLSSGIITSGVYIGSGAILGQKAGGPFNIASGSIGTNDIGSGQVQSGNILSGNVAFSHLSSGSVRGFLAGFRHILSGSIGDIDLASGQIAGHVSVVGVNSQNHIASGTLDGYNFASGALADWSQYLLANVSGLGHIGPAITEETVSGVRAVTLSASGNIKVAMASVATRMPAIGVVVENVASGIPANVFLFGQFQFSSGMSDYSGYVGTPLFVGRSGQIVTTSGSWNSGGLLSGDAYQQVGYAFNSGAASLQVDAPSISGGPPVIASGGVGSGAIASGAVQGFFGATRDIASGTVGVFDLGSGAVIAGTVGSGAIQSGNIASGQVGGSAFASGAITSGWTIGSGALFGRLGPEFLIASGTIGTFDIGSGQVVSGLIASGQIGQKHLSSGIITSGNYIGSGTILGQQGGGPFNVASGTLGKFDLSSGIITSGVYIGSGTILGQAGGGPFNVASGTITTNDIGSGAIVSGLVASGQIGSYHLGSGTQADWSQYVLANSSGPSRFATAITQETVSGVRAVNLTASGHLQVAMASVAARMPACGVVVDNVASGIPANVFLFGQFQLTSGLADYSGYVGTVLAVGRSGQIVSQSGSFNSGGLLSGDVYQPVGFALSSGAVMLQVDAPSVSGVSVTSGGLGSGSVGGFFGTRQIASGTVGVFDFGSGAVIAGTVGSGAIQSGNIASGQVGNAALASGSITSGVAIGSGAIWGRAGVNQFMIASGTIKDFDIASGGILSGNIASGQIGQKHLASGIITSGVYIGSGTILGQAGGGPFNVASGTLDNFDLSSGLITSGVYICSGAILGQAGGGPFNIASGTIGTFDIGSGAIRSGHIASGQVANFAVGSGAVTSGRIGMGGTPTGTNFFRDDFTWASPGAASVTSGSVTQITFASGAGPEYLMAYVSGLNNPNPVITEETVSGCMAVCISQSGHIRVAMASVSGRMPAVGVVVDNVASGIQCNVYTDGNFQLSSGLADYSGYIGQLLYVGRSGQVVTASGSFNSGGLLSGDITQPIGTVMNSGSPDISVATTIPFVAGLITSGNIASGQVGSPHLAAGAVLSGHIGSGQVAGIHLASGAITSGVWIGSGALWGRFGVRGFMIASGTIGTFDISSGGVVSGNIASGQIGTYHLASGNTETNTRNVTPLWSGNAFKVAISSEAISGIKAVCVDITNSGSIRTAMAATSGRMPAIGVVADNITSGIAVNVISMGYVPFGSGIMGSGYLQGQTLYVGASGDIITLSGGYGSGGFGAPSGMICQRMGKVHFTASGRTSGAYLINTVDGPYTSGIASGANYFLVMGFGY